MGFSLVGNATAGGAVKGLQDVLAQRFEQQQFEELQRQALALEAQRQAELQQRESQFGRRLSADTGMHRERIDLDKLQHKDTHGLNTDKFAFEKTDVGRQQGNVDAQRAQEAAWRGLQMQDNAEDRASRERIAQTAAAAASARREGLTDYQQLNAVNSLNTKYMANTRASREITRQYGVMKEAWSAYTGGKLSKGLAEQPIIAAFNKILDPESVVREGEYDRTAQGQSLLQRMQVLRDKVPKGGVASDQTLRQMVALGDTYMKNAEDYRQREVRRVTKIAKMAGLDPAMIFTEDDDDAAPAATTAPVAPPVGAAPVITRGGLPNVGSVVQGLQAPPAAAGAPAAGSGDPAMDLYLSRRPKG